MTLSYCGTWIVLDSKDLVWMLWNSIAMTTLAEVNTLFVLNGMNPALWYTPFHWIEVRRSNTLSRWETAPSIATTSAWTDPFELGTFWYTHRAYTVNLSWSSPSVFNCITVIQLWLYIDEPSRRKCFFSNDFIDLYKMPIWSWPFKHNATEFIIVNSIWSSESELQSFVCIMTNALKPCSKWMFLIGNIIFVINYCIHQFVGKVPWMVLKSRINLSRNLRNFSDDGWGMVSLD